MQRGHCRGVAIFIPLEQSHWVTASRCALASKHVTRRAPGPQHLCRGPRQNQTLWHESTSSSHLWAKPGFASQPRTICNTLVPEHRSLRRSLRTQRLLRGGRSSASSASTLVEPAHPAPWACLRGISSAEREQRQRLPHTQTSPPTSLNQAAPGALINQPYSRRELL